MTQTVVGARNTGLQAVLSRLEARGMVTRPTRKRLKSFRAVKSRAASLSSAVIEDREDRFR